MRRSGAIWRLGATGLAVLLAGAAQAALVNGGFETPDRGLGTAYSMLAPASVPGWQTTDSVIEIWSNSFQGVPAYEGTQHVEINANIAGTLFQDIAGIAAGERLSFSFAHRARRGTDRMRFALTDLGADGVFGSADDAVLFSEEFSATTASWVVNSSSTFAPVTAAGGILRLAFTPVSTGSGRISIGNFVDAVELTSVAPSPVPAPPGLLLLATGLVAAGGMRARRSRRRVPLG